MKICFVTHNENKLREVRQLLPNYQIVGLSDIGYHEEIQEYGNTISENSKIKANVVLNRFGISCFADDTGLEVEALNGAPGVYSARYAGVQKCNQDNIDLLLKNLIPFKNRKARFRTVITLMLKGETHQFEGIVNGEIATALKNSKGQKGFGYDSVFVPNDDSRSFAEMLSSEKNAISHRGKAIEKLVTFFGQNAPVLDYTI